MVSHASVWPYEYVTTDHGDLVLSIASGNHSEKMFQRILRLALAENLTCSHSSPPFGDPWLGQLGWTPVETSPTGSPKLLQVL